MDKSVNIQYSRKKKFFTQDRNESSAYALINNVFKLPSNVRVASHEIVKMRLEECLGV